MFDEAKWNEALVERGKYAEEKFTKGEKPSEEDVVVIALLYPDKFDILVKNKENHE